MDVIRLGKRVVPANQIAFIEPFKTSANPEFNPEREFRGRAVLVNRDTVLIEQSPPEFAKDHGLRMLENDGIAVNPAVLFRIETFEPSDDFNPGKAYQTRIKWRDQSGNQQSRLLLTEAEVVAAAVSPRQARRSKRRDRTTGAVRSVLSPDS